MRRRERKKMLMRQRHGHQMTLWLVTVWAEKAAEIVQRLRTLQGHLFDGQTTAAAPLGHRGGGQQYRGTTGRRKDRQERTLALSYGA